MTEMFRLKDRRRFLEAITTGACSLPGLSLVLILAMPVCMAQSDVSSLADQFSRPAYTNPDNPQGLHPLLPEGQTLTLKKWKNEKNLQRKEWTNLLGKPSFGAYEKSSIIIERFNRPQFKATVFRQPTGPETRQLVLMMEPPTSAKSPRPGAIIPFYHPDAMAGFDLTRKRLLTNDTNIQFGRHLVQQGYVVVCTEAFPYNMVSEQDNLPGLSIWKVAAEKLLKTHPDWTGMGKLVHDTRRAVDLLLEQPDIDPDRVLIMGHSLGGKMAFYTACLDERIKATIANDFGIGWNFTNWNDPWYLGEQVLSDSFPLQHHQLLALHAPRPFLLIGGSYDKPESWPYLLAAQKIYQLYGKQSAVGMIDHASGHRPPMKVLKLAYQWLAEQFKLPYRAGNPVLE